MNQTGDNMDEPIAIQLAVAIITAVGLVFGKWQSGKVSGLTQQVEALTQRTQNLEADNKKKDSVIAQLRIEIKELHDKLYAALSGKKKGDGVF